MSAPSSTSENFSKLFPMAMEVSTNGGLLYHEVQESNLCAVHCLNTLLQGPFFSKVDLASIASEIDQAEREVMNREGDDFWEDFLTQNSHNVSTAGDFSIQVSRSSSVPPNTGDLLYQALPPSIKSALRAKLQSFQVKEELTVPQIKSEMEKTLRWFVPISTNTAKMEVNRKPAGQTGLIHVEMLHHADKEKTEACILDLVVWLHFLIGHTKASTGGIKSPIKSPIRSPTKKGMNVASSINKPMLTKEDQEMLRYVTLRKLTPGISKSQEFDTVKCKLSKNNRLSKSINASTSHSPMNGKKKVPMTIRRPSMLPGIDFDIDRIKALDVIDRVDTFRKL